MAPKCKAHLCYMYKSKTQIKREEQTSSPHAIILQGFRSCWLVTVAQAWSGFTFIMGISLPPPLATLGTRVQAGPVLQ